MAPPNSSALRKAGEAVDAEDGDGFEDEGLMSLAASLDIVSSCASRALVSPSPLIAAAAATRSLAIRSAYCRASASRAWKADRRKTEQITKIPIRDARMTEEAFFSPSVCRSPSVPALLLHSRASSSPISPPTQMHLDVPVRVSQTRQGDEQSQNFSIPERSDATRVP